MSSLYNDIIEESKNFDGSCIIWDHIHIDHDEQTVRGFPAKYINKTIQLLEMMGAKTMVEIGSTRIPVTDKCVVYYNDWENISDDDRPRCCQDGHSTYFFTKYGPFDEVYTVDISETCLKYLHDQYQHVREDFPDKLKVNIPKDGIEFLQEFDKQIDYLYLDGWDVGTGGYRERHLEAFEVAKDKLAPLHLITIDDTDFDIPNGEGGKDHLLAPELIKQGYIELWSGRQRTFINTP